ncbi:hypothetical protein FA15DRAFT_699666 [Coprinopsis marcescibilis]|uniref:Uncharacterized protein n=1 Tax=Coprinopsis marcescibilis TaxID=230819 RepID=A0A5C3LBY1_COPMA|nr:hypothetical protein FA15DRAFT_699666 [Coprinopsis marcescibilis]
MFEEICLVCGKHLNDDGRAYCSDDCQSTDLASPSISSSSSALSSPQLGYAQGGDVPALIPAALGTALRKYQGRGVYYVNSSASSSKSWSLVDDDEDGQSYTRREYGLRGGADSLYDGGSKSANYVYSMLPSALSYARRPSGTNNHSTVPQVHQRNSSGSSPAPRARASDHGAPRPNRTNSSTDEEELSDYSLSSRDAAEDVDSERDFANPKSRRARNRTSLPACFSLLQISSPSAKEVKASPVSTASAKTIARPSPPTPKHTTVSEYLSKSIYAPFRSNLPHETPRGRQQREAEGSRSSRRSERSSPSPSRSRSRHVRNLQNDQRLPDKKSNVEQVLDWDCAEIPRGRTTVRRSSSPPRLLMGVDDTVKTIAALRDAIERSQSNSQSRARRGRGRVTVEELEGVGSFTQAPGYGNGRSGLLNRERFPAQRVPL